MRRIMVMVCLCLLTLRVFAQSVPVTPMQNAVSGVMQSKMAQRGFASNDPRYGATLQSAGTAIAGAAAAAAVVTFAGITAPAWVTAGVTVGLGILLTAGINLAIDGVKWLLNSDGSVSVPGPAAPPYQGQVWSDGMYADISLGQDCLPLQAGGTYLGHASGTLPFNYGCSNFNVSPPLAYKTYTASASLLNGGAGSNTVVQPNISAAASSLLPAELAKPANPQIIASIADTAWRNAAAQPGYAGIPYDVTNPITASDAAAWKAANPTSWPTVGDVVTPQAVPSNGTAATPWQLPNSASPITSQPASQTPTTSNPSAGEQVNLGPDPNIGFPIFEATPTALMILQPLIDLFPSLRNFVVPSHGGECPKPSADIFGKHVQMDGHCTLLEPVRGDLSAVMAFVWIMIALLIILAA